MADDLLKDSGLPEEIWESLAKDTQTIKVFAERRRWGKYMTVISGLDSSVDTRKLLKDLKRKLACGGTYKNNQIELQGDHRKRMVKTLVGLGFQEKGIEVK
ncbi:MAG: stress response translation initiation inhibitor YciH [Candidatus Altiarchaeota archaeon]|nr:stress response translation initiation inhibitor YciH [Candidatus Altiarchaeota archaeon]